MWQPRPVTCEKASAFHAVRSRTRLEPYGVSHPFFERFPIGCRSAPSELAKAVRVTSGHPVVPKPAGCCRQICRGRPLLLSANGSITCSNVSR
jgi:hypothetical protein